MRLKGGEEQEIVLREFTLPRLWALGWSWDEGEQDAGVRSEQIYLLT